MIAPRRIFLTGASGALGSALLPALVRRGHHVTAAGRDSAAADGMLFDPLGGHLDSRFASAGFDTVINLGDGLKALETERLGTASMRTAHQLLAGNQRLADAAMRSGARLFLHISSIKAIAGEKAGAVLSETAPARPTGAYGIAKQALEQRLRLAFQGEPCSLILLRNPLTYGPGAMGGLARLLGLIERGVPLPHQAADARRSLLAVANFVDAIVTVLEADAPPAGAYHIHDGEPLALTTIVRTLAAGLQRPPRLVRVPAVLWRAASAVPSLRSNLDRLGGSLVLDDSHFRQTFNWQPNVDTEPELTATAAAYRASRDNRRHRI